MELFWQFIKEVFDTWAEKVGIILTILPFIEKIPRVRTWLNEKPFIDRFVPLLWVIGGFCIIWGFYAAWKDKNDEVVNLRARLAAPRFEGRITALSSMTTPSGAVLLAGGILMNPTGPPSVAIDWQMHLEFNPSTKIVGQMMQEPDADRDFVMSNGMKAILKHDNWWPTKAATPIAPGGVAGGWLWALFPGLSADEIYEKHAIVVVDFRDAVIGEWHHISLPVPEKGLHMPPVI